MPSVSQVISENSEGFLPAFARLGKAQSALSRYRPLDIQFDQSGPLANEGETEIARWAVVGGADFTTTSHGLPIDVDAGRRDGQLKSLFYGGAEFVLTDQRLLALVIEGDTAVGKVGGRTGNVLALTFPLSRIDSVGVELKQKAFGGVKETKLQVMCLSHTVANLYFESIIAGPTRGPRGMQRYSGTMKDILEAMVQPIIEARLALNPGDPAVRQHLGSVRSGARHRTPTEYAAIFAND